jgi:hypothetical protein
MDTMDGTIYWRFKTILNHSPEDDTVLVEWYGMAKPNKKLGLSKKTCVSLIVRKITWRM